MRGTRGGSIVAYQELNLMDDLPDHLRQYIPNMHYSSSWNPWSGDLTRVVLLIATTDIDADHKHRSGGPGVELLSTYHTLAI